MSVENPLGMGLLVVESTPYNYTKTAPRRCVNTVDPRGLADWIGVD